MATLGFKKAFTTLKAYFSHPVLASSIDFLEPMKFELFALFLILILPLAPSWSKAALTNIIQNAGHLGLNIIAWPGLFPFLSLAKSLATSPAIKLVFSWINLILYLVSQFIYLAFVFQAIMMVFYTTSSFLVITYTFAKTLSPLTLAPWIILTLPALYFMPLYTCAAALFTAYRSDVHWSSLFKHTVNVVGKEAGIRDFDSNDETAAIPRLPDGEQGMVHPTALVAGGEAQEVMLDVSLKGQGGAMIGGLEVVRAEDVPLPEDREGELFMSQKLVMREIGAAALSIF